MASTRKKHSLFFYTLLALISAILLGLLLRLTPAVAEIIADYLLTPVKTIYLNALKLVVTPVVFFAISSSVSGISDYRSYGRIGFKVVLLYMLTSAAATGIGLGLGAMLQPGSGVVLDTTQAAYTASPVEISLIDTIVNLVPSNPLTPFTEANMTQIIFLSLLLGAGAGIMEQRSGLSQFRKALDLMNQFFLTVSGLVLRLIPVGTFCAVTLLVTALDAPLLLGVVRLIATVVLGVFIMLCLYGLLFFLITRLNPFLLLKGILPNLTAFALLCSTSAVMPQTLDTCTHRLGIDPKISAFSIPLGSTINMDGACIYLTVAAMFLAQLYGIQLTPAMVFQLSFTTLILSVGAPPMPGSGFICLSVLVLQLGLPIESIGFLLGIDQLMSMCRTVTNGAGDIVCTAVVAYSEGQMNVDIFKGIASK